MLSQDFCSSLSLFHFVHVRTQKYLEEWQGDTYNSALIANILEIIIYFMKSRVLSCHFPIPRV